MSNRKGIWFPVIFLVIASIACSVPVIDRIFTSNPTPTTAQVTIEVPAGPTSTPLPPLPPSLIEIEPALGEELKPDDHITLYFDQPMDTTSVEAAITMKPAMVTDLLWLDESTLQVSPSEPLALASKYNLTIGKGAKSSFGLPLTEAIQLPYHSAGYLEVTQVIPQPGTFEVNPSTPITVVFNRPVVPLEIEGDPVQPLTFIPPISGQGEWISTSMYRFQPDQPLPGGTSIRAEVESTLKDIGGSHLAENYEWSFFTSLPEILSVDPLPDESDVPLNQEFRITFNQAMDPLQTQQAFSMTSDDDERVAGDFSWEEEGTVLVFQPSVFLDYAQRYSILVTQDAQNPQGTPLTNGLFFTFDTMLEPEVVASTPRQGGTKSYNQLLSITFSTPMDEATIPQAITIEPNVENYGGFWRQDSNQWVVYGDFEPATFYRLSLDETAKDIVGTPIKEGFNLRFSTADLPPRLDFVRNNEVMTLTTYRPPQVDVQVRNLTRVDLSLYRLSLDQFFSLLRSGSYSYPEPTPVGERLQEWSQPVSTDKNVTEVLTVALLPRDLSSGPYMLIVDSPDHNDKAIVRLLLVRDIELVIKSTMEEALVWAVDLSTGEPVADLLTTIYAYDGVRLGEEQTNTDGILELTFPQAQDPYDPIFAVTGTPGEPGFGLTASTWADGIHSYDFGIWMNPQLENAKVYLYTDRPLYRPGHTVHFRGVIRDIENDQFQLPQDTSLSVALFDALGEEVQTQEVTVSSFGTFQGAFKLNQEAALGEYLIQTEHGVVFFEVAAYRKPEFIVTVIPSIENVAQGDPLSAQIEAQYFFGGPVAEAEVTWQVYTQPIFPIGIPEAINWFHRASWYQPIFNYHSLASGEGKTDVDGILEIEIPTTLDDTRPQHVIIEATLTDASGFPVTETGSLTLHPATIYLGLDPDRYSIREQETALVRLSALDWDGNLVPGQVAQIDVERVTWKQIVTEAGQLSYETQSSLVNQAYLTTSEDGTVLFSFEPDTSGTYKVRASSKDPQGRDVQTELTLWVSGKESRIWRQPSAERIVLVPDRETYVPGDTAKIFVPAPFEEPVEALVTIERRGVLSHERMTIEGSETILSIPIEENHIPNIFVSAVLIRPASPTNPESIAVGLVELDIDPGSKQLDVQLNSTPTTSEPRGTVVYDLLVTDASGNPVEAEFSLALVDLAVLSLTEPNSLKPIDSLYASQNLGVRTGASVSLKAEGLMPVAAPDGIGGGGGGAGVLEIRSEFPDTAYWDPSVITDSEGRAQVTLTLPDSLTTWRLDVRGVTEETLVGSAIMDVVSTKDLLIRPITPRFFTAGDAASVAAVIHNQTKQVLPVEIRLSANGAEITDPLTQRATIPSMGQERVEWSLNVQEVEGVDLTFYVSGGGLEDASKPTIGTTEDGILPVLSYSAPDTAATAGELEDADTVREAINLPRSYDASRGELQVTLDPSLGSALTNALDVLEHHPYDSTERLISRFLPNLYTYISLQEMGIDDATLETRVQQSLEDALQTLYQRQNWDGGWGWWRGGPSDIYLTAYGYYTLSHADRAGLQIKDTVLDQAVQFLRAGIVSPDLTQQAEILDRQSFVLYVLALADEGDLPTTLELASRYEILSTWARALLANALSHMDPSATELSTLLSDLESSALLSGTGTHWQERSIHYWNLESNIRTTAQVLMTLIETNPSSSSIPGAVRWLLASRSQDGLWRSSHENAWAIQALAAWMQSNEAFQSNYDYMLQLNGQTLTSGSTSQDAILSSVEVVTPMSDLLKGQPNQVSIQRGLGDGTLFYTAYLTVYRPVEDIEATARGMHVYREYFIDDGECGDLESPCPKATSANLGDDLLVRVTLIVPSDQYHVVIEDPYPAGLEPREPREYITDPNQISLEEVAESEADQLWKWWYFTRVEIGDDRLSMYAEYLPAGTYQYTYPLRAVHPGEYRVLPTRAWANYFPEIYAHSAGEVFSIKP